MKPILNIITPCIRPQNLPAIGLNIAEANKDYWFDIQWHIVFDGPADDMILKQRLEESHILPIIYSFEHEGYGGAQRNLALDNIRAGWVYFLDDDNLLNIDFLDFASKLIKSGYNAFMFGVEVTQKDDVDKFLPAHPENIEPDCCDTAQFLVKRTLIGDIRWGDRYNADGYFFRDIYERNPNTFVFKDYKVRYNALR